MARFIHLLLQIGLMALIFPVSDDAFRRVFLLFIATFGQLILLFAERFLAEDENQKSFLMEICYKAFLVYLLVLTVAIIADFHYLIPPTYLTCWFYGAYGLAVFATFVSVLLFVRELRARKKPAKTPVL